MKTKRIKDNRPTANPDDVQHWLQRNDIALYASRKKIKDARKQCSNESVSSANLSQHSEG